MACVTPAASRMEGKFLRGSGCWLWVAAKDGEGYGSIAPGLGEQAHGAHRVMYEKTYGPIPEGMFVCHACDNRGCVNPAHLFLGTQKDNIADMWSKGRGVVPSFSGPGEDSPQAKLTWETVREIRERYAAGGISQAELASVYGVSQSAVALIVNNKTWKEVA